MACGCNNNWNNGCGRNNNWNYGRGGNNGCGRNNNWNYGRGGNGGWGRCNNWNNGGRCGRDFDRDFDCDFDYEFGRGGRGGNNCRRFEDAIIINGNDTDVAEFVGFAPVYEVEEDHCGCCRR